MPALPSVPKGVRLDVHMTEDVTPNMQIREFFQYSGTLNEADAATWLTNIRASFVSHIIPVLVTGCNLVGMELTDLSSPSAVQVLNNTGASGSNGTDRLAPGTAFVIRKHIARRYRGGHPRVYLPGLRAANLTSGGVWDSTFAGTLTGDYLAWIADCVANTNPAAIGTITHINISYYQGFTNHLYPSGRVKAIPTPRVTPLVDLIDTATYNPKPGSQRRRNEQVA